MGHPDCKSPVFVFRHDWPGCWAGEYQYAFSWRIPAQYFILGIPSGKCNLCRDRRSHIGPCPSRLPSAFATPFDIDRFQAAKDASASQDKLIELFNRIERFFGRLEIYTGITPTTAMRAIIIDIMVEILSILAIATKEVKRGRFSEFISHRFSILGPTPCLEKYFMKLTGNTDIEDSLDKLDKLTREEARMASAELLKITRIVDSKVMGVDDRVKGVEEKVQDVRDDVHDVEGKLKDVRGDVQDVGDRVQSIDGNINRVSNRVQGADEKLEQVNCSLFLYFKSCCPLQVLIPLCREPAQR